MNAARQSVRIADAARMTGLSPDWFEARIKDGTLQAFRTTSRPGQKAMIVVRIDDINALFEAVHPGQGKEATPLRVEPSAVNQMEGRA